MAMYVYSFNTYPCIYIYHYQHSIARAEARCSQTHQGAHCHRSRDQTASSSSHDPRTFSPGRGSTGQRAAPPLQSPQNQPRPDRILRAPAAPPPPAWRRASSTSRFTTLGSTSPFHDVGLMWSLTRPDSLRATSGQVQHQKMVW